MAERKVVQKTSFLGGEAGPLLEGRSDLAQFQLGLSPGQNFINLKGGAVTRRPPTQYIKATQGGVIARCFPFEISRDFTSEQFILEISQPVAATTLVFRVVRASSGTVFTPSGSPLTVSNTVATGSVDLNNIQVSQSTTKLYIVGKGFEPQVLTLTPDPTQILGGGRVGTTPTFALATYIGTAADSRSAWFSMPYRTANISATTLAIDTATVGTGRTLTASAAIFSQSHIGAYFRSNVSATQGYCRITAVGGSGLQTTATVEVVSAFGGTGTTTDWSEGAWSEYRGWPRTITQYGQRLVFGGNTSQPDTFWMSQVGDYLQMSAATAGIDDPLQFTLNAEKANHINWMVGGKKLTIGTATSEWVGTVTNDGTNLFVQFDEETTHGSLYVQTQRVGYSIPFVQQSGKTIREIQFSFDSDTYEATDINLFGSHVGSDAEICQLAHQESPFNIMWAIDTAGSLYGLTRDKQQQIASWHTHVIGGASVKVRSICVVGNSLYMIVERVINSTTVWFLEKLTSIVSRSTITPSVSLPPFLDAHVYAAAASTVTWNGYTQYASSNVYVVAWDANGAIVQTGITAVSAAGVITLSRAATNLYVGLHADAILRPLHVEGGDAPEIKMNSEKGLDSVSIRMYQTWGLRIGKNRVVRKSGNEVNTTFEPIPFDDTSLPTIETFTGTKTVPVPCDEGTDVSLALAMQEPWPCTILSLSMRVTNNEV